MPSEIVRSWLMACQDQHGNPVNIGAGYTITGMIVLIGPINSEARLDPHETARFLGIVRRAVDAAEKHVVCP